MTCLRFPTFGPSLSSWGINDIGKMVRERETTAENRQAVVDEVIQGYAQMSAAGGRKASGCLSFRSCPMGECRAAITLPTVRRSATVTPSTPGLGCRDIARSRNVPDSLKPTLDRVRFGRIDADMQLCILTIRILALEPKIINDRHSAHLTHRRR